MSRPTMGGAPFTKAAMRRALPETNGCSEPSIPYRFHKKQAPTPAPGTLPPDSSHIPSRFVPTSRPKPEPLAHAAGRPRPAGPFHYGGAAGLFEVHLDLARPACLS